MFNKHTLFSACDIMPKETLLLGTNIFFYEDNSVIFLYYLGGMLDIDIFVSLIVIAQSDVLLSITSQARRCG